MGEQHIPIFVGSTFTDLKEYRAKVRDTLTRMETFVHGMEQFGARPGCPVDECLAEVRKCKIYIGIFAMRYGSIPAGYDKSMTELEYDEAQRLELPSYIFVIDEKEAKLTVSDIDFEHQVQLNALKEKLTSRHMVEYFTSPDDLANKVGSAIHRALQEIKTENIVIEKGIEKIVSKQNELPGEIIWRRFQLFPRRWIGMQLELKIDNFESKGYDKKVIFPISNPDEFIIMSCSLDPIESIITECYISGTNIKVKFVADGENVYPFVDANSCTTFSIVGETAGYLDPINTKHILLVKVKTITEIQNYTFENDIPF